MYARVIKALSLLPAELASALKPIIEDSNFDSTISPEQFECLLSTTHMTDTELRLALLPLAASYAVVPISNFYVGAIVRGTSGRLYFGANMEFENASMACTIHAEQSAISHAWIKGEVGIKDVTINYSPCGHCRQFMNELTSARIVPRSCLPTSVTLPSMVAASRDRLENPSSRERSKFLSSLTPPERRLTLPSLAPRDGETSFSSKDLRPSPRPSASTRVVFLWTQLGEMLTSRFWLLVSVQLTCSALPKTQVQGRDPSS